MPDAPLRVYAIFFEITEGDRGAKYNVDPLELLDDPRVTLYWDERRVTGRWFDENVTGGGKRNGEPDRVEWDAYILYNPRSEWGDDPPFAVSWGRPVIQEKNRLFRDLEGALGRVRE